MAQRTTPEIRELQQRWIAAVLLGDVDLGPIEMDPDHGLDWMLATRPVQRCWFGVNVPGIDSCEGRPEGAHWIKRQRVEECIVQNLYRGFGSPFNADTARDLKHLAAWDPRNGVPACEKHHRRFDAQRMPTLVVWRHEVPAHVEAFCRDWPLEGDLERRNPPINKGV